MILGTSDGWTELYVSTVNSYVIDFFVMTSTPNGCEYAVLRVSRTGGNSLITGRLEHAPQ